MRESVIDDYEDPVGEFLLALFAIAIGLLGGAAIGGAIGGLMAWAASHVGLPLWVVAAAFGSVPFAVAERFTDDEPSRWRALRRSAFGAAGAAVVVATMPASLVFVGIVAGTAAGAIGGVGIAASLADD